MNKAKLVFLAIIVTMVASSCRINNNIILKTKRNYPFDELPTETPPEYIIAPGDILSFSLYQNNGAALIEGGAGNGNQQTGNNRGGGAGGYYIRTNGLVELPYLGDINLTGKTVKEAEDYLEELYSKYYRDVFVMLQVTNKRIYVSLGGVGQASVVTLPTNSTTLFEVLAMAGGISDRGNSKRIKIIRRIGNDIEVYKIDLSTIDNIKDGNFILQANDFVYVEPFKQVASQVQSQIISFFSLISTAILIYTFSTSNPFK